VSYLLSVLDDSRRVAWVSGIYEYRLIVAAWYFHCHDRNKWVDLGVTMLLVFGPLKEGQQVVIGRVRETWSVL
jgi:hypothetical protein